MRLLAAVVILSSSLLTACPGEDPNNGVAPEKDMTAEGDAGTDAAPDLPEADAAPDVPAEPGRIVIEPEQITFGAVRHGETETAVVAITNVGGQPVVVSNVMLQELNRTGEPELLPGPNFETTFEVGPGLHREIDVVYEPKDYGADRGILEIWTTDPEAEMNQIRIEALNAYADVEAPKFVRFGEVPAGESVTKRIAVVNRGIDPLTISDAVLGGTSQEFSITFEENASPPTVVETNGDFLIDVQYGPVDLGTDRGTITLTTDDPDDPTWEIALTGNDPTPCIDVAPDPVDFGELAAGTAGMQQVTLLNCSRTLGLEVTSIALADDGGGTFTVGSLPELPLQLAPLQTSAFRSRRPSPNLACRPGKSPSNPPTPNSMAPSSSAPPYPITPEGAHFLSASSFVGGMRSATI